MSTKLQILRLYGFVTDASKMWLENLTLSRTQPLLDPRIILSLDCIEINKVKNILVEHKAYLLNNICSISLLQNDYFLSNPLSIHV